MILDRDCVRDLLLTIESDSFNNTLFLGQICENTRMKSYSKETVTYVIQKLQEANYINASILIADGAPYQVAVSSLTWEGHNFLDNVRDPSIWDKVKSRSSKLNSVSLPLLSELGLSFVKEQIGLA